MWPRSRRRLKLTVLGGVLSLSAAVAPMMVLAAEVPIPCVPVGPCLPVPPGLPKPPAPGPRPTPLPSPTAAPTPPGQPPVPGPAPGPAIGTDVGIGSLQAWVENGGSWQARLLQGILTGPNWGGDWFLPIYDRMTTIAIYVLLLCLLLTVLQFLLHRRFGIIAVSWLGWAPGSIAITAVAITLTNLALAITDGFSTYMLQGMGADVPSFLMHLAAVLGLIAGGSLATGQAAFVAFMMSAFIVIGLIGIVVELLIRQLVIYTCLLWMPLVAASSVWPPARTWMIRLATLELAAILAKFAVVVSLALGVAAFAANPLSMGSLGDSNVTAIAMGLIVLGFAFVSPLALAKLLPFSFEHAASAWTGRARGAAWQSAHRVRGHLLRRGVKSGAAQAGVPIASKAAGAAAAPIYLTIRGGQVFLRRGRAALGGGKSGAQAARPGRPSKQGGRRRGPGGGPPPGGRYPSPPKSSPKS
jgi:hypothetical protein